VDGGGTSTRVGVALAGGTERIRRTGPAGIVDPRNPEGSADTLVRLIRDTVEEAGIRLPAAALCAGLAGARSGGQRARVVAALRSAGVADRVEVVTDAEIALEGALPGEPGILLIAGTGSVAWGRGEDGRIGRCGGWGMWVGDEGSGYAIGVAGLRAALKAGDGRGPGTELGLELAGALGLNDLDEVPSWTAAAEKSEIGRLAPVVIAVAGRGDHVADAILDDAAAELRSHVGALVERLGPWASPVPVVFHGGLFQEPGMVARVGAVVRGAGG
jgi:glucosamine kinase